MQATSSFPALLGTTTNDLSTGFYAAQYSFSGTPNGDENLYVGAEDPDGNQAYVAYHKSDNSWFTDTEGATSHSGDVLVTPVTVSDGDWIGIGNIGSDNIIHAYHSVDGQSWTEFYRFVVGGSFNKSLTSFSVVVADSSGSGSLVISIDNASFFMPAPQSFQITWASAISTGADTYTISSL